jgi:RsmE family RNA methyltransferase
MRKGLMALACFRFCSVHGWISLQGRKTTTASIRPSSYHSSVVCRLNRFLFDSSDILRNGDNALVTLSKDDYRTIHAAKILNLRNGDTLRCGVVSCADHGGLITDDATVEWIPEGKVKKPQVLGNGEPPGSLQVNLHNLVSPDIHLETPPVSLILALPRPLALGRILPMVSQMGIEKLVLTEARKVPKEYFGSHLFRKPHLLRERLIEGLCQSGDSRLPLVHVVRNLSDFLSCELDTLFPLDEYARVIAHPQRMGLVDRVSRIRDVTFPISTKEGRRKMVIAVGPEGGWEEPDELDLFTSRHEFQQVTLGRRVLRSDCAVVSLLGLSHDACCSES